MRRNLWEEAEPGEDLFGIENEDEAKKESLDSVDDQIDSYILRFENESIKDADEEMIMESLRLRTLRFLLEQEEGEDAESAEAPAPDAEEEPDAEEQEISDPTGSEEPKEDPQGVAPKPPLDIDAFTKKVARLVMNYRDLLRVEPVIVNRAIAFLEKNYGNKGKDYVDRMVDILDSQYDFNLEGEIDVIDVPIATGAGVKSSGA
jgi:hypothetical protein